MTFKTKDTYTGNNVPQKYPPALGPGCQMHIVSKKRQRSYVVAVFKVHNTSSGHHIVKPDAFAAYCEVNSIWRDSKHRAAESMIEQVRLGCARHRDRQLT